MLKTFNCSTASLSQCNSNRGFTLIEVMVALAIFALIGVSIMQVTSTQLANTFYLEQRLMSQWLAENLINQIKVEPNKWNITQCGGSRSGELTYVERRWTYQLRITANPFDIKANELTGDYGKKLCQLELELFLPDSQAESIGTYRGYYGVTP
jgi:general secretion pathway protein I